MPTMRDITYFDWEQPFVKQWNNRNLIKWKGAHPWWDTNPRPLNQMSSSLTTAFSIYIYIYIYMYIYTYVAFVWFLLRVICVWDFEKDMEALKEIIREVISRRHIDITMSKHNKFKHDLFSEKNG